MEYYMNHYTYKKLYIVSNYFYKDFNLFNYNLFNILVMIYIIDIILKY